MADYAALRSHQEHLIRKALQGSVFLAPSTAPAITSLTTYTAASAGPPAVPESVDLAPLPTGYADLGLLTNDGVSFSRDVSTSDVTSWGRVTPTRTDVVTDTSTLSVTAQETNLLTIGLGTGADVAAADRAANTGEVSILKPLRANPKSYRCLVLAVDENEAGEIYVARFLPNAKVTGFSDQAFGGGDDPIAWGVTLAGNEDNTLGYSERWIFGGMGWRSLLTDMGFTAV